MESADYILHKKFRYAREHKRIAGENYIAYVIYVKVQSNELYSYISTMLTNCLPDEIMLIVDSDRYDTDDIMRSFPSVDLIELLRPMSTGRILNIVSRCLESKYFLYFDSVIKAVSTDSDIILKIFHSSKKPVAVTGLLCGRTGCIVPGIRIPQLKRVFATTLVVSQIFEIQDTLYPVSGFAVYDRNAIAEIGGFDEDIQDNYFCLYDFFVRSWLLGFSVCSYSSLILFTSDLNCHREQICCNEYMSKINYRILNYYRRFKSNFVNHFYLIFNRNNDVKRMHDTVADYHLDYKTLVKRWKIDDEFSNYIMEE